MNKAILFLLTPAILAMAMAAAAETNLLTSRRTPGEIDKVQILLEIGGEITTVQAGKECELKMSAVNKLAYHEKTTQLAGDDQQGPRAVRYYDAAEAVVKIDEATMKTELRPQRKLIAGESQTDKVVLFSPAGRLSRDELAMLDIQGNTMLLDDFLPAEAVATGDKWHMSNEMIASFFGLDEVTENKLEIKLTEVTDDLARMEISGVVEGTDNWAPTKMELKGKYRYDRRHGRIDWFALLTKVKRDAGLVDTGLDAVARLQVRITPKAKCEQLSDAALKQVSLKSDPSSLELEHDSPNGDWRFTHDRRWFFVQSSSSGGELRMVDGGKELATCKVSSPSTSKSDKIIELGQFQEDVRAALGEDFGEFLSAKLEMSPVGYRVYRVAASGKGGKVPTQWRYHMVAEESGRRVVFAFEVKEPMAEQFGAEDKKLVDSLRFMDAE